MARQRDDGQPPGTPGEPYSKKPLSALERVLQQALGSGRELGAQDDPGKAKWPELWKWLTTIYVGPNHIKQPARLNISMGPEGVLVQLSDRDLACGIGISCPHLVDVFEALERALTGPNPPIQSWGKSEPKVRKRKMG